MKLFRDHEEWLEQWQEKLRQKQEEVAAPEPIRVTPTSGLDYPLRKTGVRHLSVPRL